MIIVDVDCSFDFIYFILRTNVHIPVKVYSPRITTLTFVFKSVVAEPTINTQSNPTQYLPFPVTTIHENCFVNSLDNFQIMFYWNLSPSFNHVIRHQLETCRCTLLEFFLEIFFVVEAWSFISPRRNFSEPFVFQLFPVWKNIAITPRTFVTKQFAFIR